MQESTDSYYVVYHRHNSRTGKHVHRDGPMGEFAAEKEAHRLSKCPDISAVWVTWGTPYFKEGQYLQFKG